MGAATAEKTTGTRDKHEMLSHIFGFESFRPGQEPIIEALLTGDDVLAVMPTGAGKSLCFQLPALMRDGLCVVISPLIALMENQVALLHSFGVNAGMIHSGRPRHENVADWQAASKGQIKLLYMSPERMMTPRMISALQDLPLSLFVIDEVHCISQWGHDFRKEYLQLRGIKELFPGVPLAAFTATADEATRKDILAQVLHGQAKSWVQGFDRPNIELCVEEKLKADKRLVSLVGARRGRQGIVYCLSRKGCEKAAAMLAAEGHNAVFYHAGLADEERTIRLNRFLTEPDLIVCATVAFGMGIDKPDIRYVIHMNLPASMEAYYQEIGRAGRDGEPAEAILFYGYSDLRLRRIMIDETQAPEEVKRVERRRLDLLASYCESASCRRNALLAYFGEVRDTPCGNCDICITPPAFVKGTQEAKRALEVIQATGEIYGQNHIMAILRGANTEKIRQAGHDKLVAYGKGRSHSDRQWRGMFRQMLTEGIINVSGEYNSIGLTPRGQQVLVGGLEVSFHRVSEKPVQTTKSRQTALGEGQVNAKLLTRLKKLRLELARKKQSPAYVIFSDRTLIDMAQKKPQDRASFETVYGIGDKKAEAYAQAFLAVIVSEES